MISRFRILAPLMGSLRKYFPHLSLVFAIATISFASILTRWANAPGPVTGFYRMGMASMILVPIFFSRRSTTPEFSRKSFWGVIIAGGILMALNLAFWNSSLNYTSVANSTLLGNTSPLWVALAALGLFRERLSGRFWGGLGLTMVGAGVVMGGDFLLHPRLSLGDALALISAVFYAGYYLATQIGRKHLNTLTYMTGITVISTITLLLMCLLLGMPLTGYPLTSFLSFLGLALFIQLGGHMAIGYALGHLPASIVSPTLLLQPVVSSLLAIPFFGESLQPATILGGLMVLVGVFVVNHSRVAQVQKAATGPVIPNPTAPLTFERSSRHIRNNRC